MNETLNNESRPVTLVDLLDRLVEVPEPAPISMVPQTWGWVAVGVVLVTALAWLMFYLFRRYRANAYRREALAELETVGDDAAAIAGILRRTALAVYPRRKVCAATGEAWLQFLESTASGLKFTSGPGECLIYAPYKPTDSTPGIGNLAQEWVRRHRNPGDQ